MKNVEAEIALNLGDGVKLELVLIRPGSFMMRWECQEFCAKLNARFADKCFRLALEAEWEYACRAGSTTKYCFWGW